MTAYAYTGAAQDYVVPAGVNYVDLTLIGAAGAQGWAEDPDFPKSGSGAAIRAVCAVTPGETLKVYVGGRPTEGNSLGGWNGGGNGFLGGGGATDVRRGGTALANRICTAGAGGGGGMSQNTYSAYGGKGGYTTGSAGAQGDAMAGTAGGGGTQSAGGARGTNAGSWGSPSQSTAGALGVGGTGAGMESWWGGGGGGGLYGGGGGGVANQALATDGGNGGGGGSSGTTGRVLSSTTAAQSSNRGHGTATVEPYVPPTPTLAVSTTGGQYSGAPLFSIDLIHLHPLASGQRIARVQVSQDSTFATTSIDTEFTLAAGASQTSITVPLNKQGVWYARVMGRGTNNLADSGWSTTRTFTVAHVPGVTIVSPTSDAFVQWAASNAFRFNASDPYTNDTISAYQIVVEENDTATVVTDTGKVAAAPQFALGQTTVQVAIPASAKDKKLRWRVRVWDWTDTVSAYSDYSLFTLVDPPAVTIIYPAEGGTSDTGAPAFSWSVGLTSGRTIASTTVTVRETATNNLVWQKTFAGAVTQVTPETTVLVNQVGYNVKVDVTDNVGLVGSDTNLFTTSYVSPDPIVYTVDDSMLNTEGYIKVDWSNQSADPRLVAWRVYRRTLPDNTWELVAEIGDENVKTFEDYLVMSGTSYMYTVSQLADRSGAILESPVGTRGSQSGDPEAESQVVAAVIEQYWILSTENPDMSIKLPNVTSAPENEEWEEATYNIIGRGRHRDYGDRLGFSGTITAEIRQPGIKSATRQAIRDLRMLQETYWLRTPFGHLFPIALGNLGWDPIAGVGLSEMGNITIDYIEVA